MLARVCQPSIDFSSLRGAGQNGIYEPSVARGSRTRSDPGRTAVAWAGGEFSQDRPEPLAAPGLHVALERAGDQRNRLGCHDRGAAAGCGRAAARDHPPDRPAVRGDDGVFPGRRVASRAHRRPGRQAPPDDLLRHRADADTRLGRGGGRFRCADNGATVRGRVPHGPGDGVLRRRVPELRAGAGRPRPVARRQRQARRDSGVLPGCRARARRCAIRLAEGWRDGRRRDLLRGLDRHAAADQGARAAAWRRGRVGCPGSGRRWRAGSDRFRWATERTLRWPEVRVRAQGAAQDCGVHGDGEPVRLDFRRPGDRLPGQGAACEADRHRPAD